MGESQNPSAKAKLSNRFLFLATSQVELFTELAMETAVECWQWVLTARQDLELCFIQEMVAAWQTTFDKKIGLFSEMISVTSPLAAYDGCQLVSKPILISPHLIWLQLLSEMVDTAKYCNRDKVEMFCLLLHRCLPIDKNMKQNRHISTIGCRFKLLQCGLSLLQGSTVSKSLARNILRERIYSNALDYFCGPPTAPTQHKDQLHDDILILLKFWQTMRSEKKHLITSELGDYDIPLMTNSGNMCATGGGVGGGIGVGGGGGGLYGTSTLHNNNNNHAYTIGYGGNLSGLSVTGGSQMLSVNKNPETMSLMSVGAEMGRSSSVVGGAIGLSGATGGGSYSGGWYNTIPHSTSTLSKRSNRSKRLLYQKDSYDKDYMKKRNLILELLAVEIEYLITWYNPNSLPDLVITGKQRESLRGMRM